MKESSLTGKNMKMRVKEIIGTCRSMGITIDDMLSEDAIAAVESVKNDRKQK